MIVTTRSSWTDATLLGLRSTGRTREHAWQAFIKRYVPLIDHWCGQAGLQPADVDEVRSRVLTSLAAAMQNFELDPAYRFPVWLRTVVKNALCSYWREFKRRPGTRGVGQCGADGDEGYHASPVSPLHTATESDDCPHVHSRLAEMATARVQQRVKSHTWEAYWRTAIEGAAPLDVAHELGLSVTLVHMAKSRVGRMLREEGVRLLEQ